MNFYEINRKYSSSSYRIANQDKVTAGEPAMDIDTGNIYIRTTSGWEQIGSGGINHAVPPDQVPGSIVIYEVINLSNSRVTRNFPSGATAIEFSYRQNSSSGTTTATGRAVYIVVNATSDPDADAKIALIGSRDRLALGDDTGEIRADSSPITRVDVQAEAVEGGHSTLKIKARIPL